MNNSMKKYKLGDLCRIKHGYPFQGEFFSDNGEYVILTPGNFYEQGGFKRIQGKEKYYLGKFTDEYMCKKGDLIVAMTQQAEGLLGSTAIVPEDNVYLHNQRIGLILPNEIIIDKLYLYYLFMTKSVRKQLRDSSSGTKVKHTSPEKIYDVNVSIPSIVEQRKIASILYDIEKKIINNNFINNNLQQQMTLMYNYWFTNFEFPDKNGKPYRSSGGKMVWNEELNREIPHGWECKSLAELLQKNNTVFDYNTIKPTVDLSVMSSASISVTQLNSSDSFSTNLFEMKEGDILFGSIRPYLRKAGIAPCDGVVAGTIHSYRPVKDNDYNFVLLTICREEFFNYAVRVSNGTKMPVISNDNLLEYKVPYSEEVVKEFNKVKVKQIICNNVKEIQRFTELRNWILPMLMNGQANISD